MRKRGGTSSVARRPVAGPFSGPISYPLWHRLRPCGRGCSIAAPGSFSVCWSLRFTSASAGLALNLRAIAANIPELLWSLEKPPLAELPFCFGRQGIAQAVDLPIRHFRCFRGFVRARPYPLDTRKPQLDKLTDGLRTCRVLSRRPFVDRRNGFGRQPNRNCLAIQPAGAAASRFSICSSLLFGHHVTCVLVIHRAYNVVRIYQKTVAQ